MSFFSVYNTILFFCLFFIVYIYFFLNESGMLDIYLFTITDIHIILLVIK